MTGVEREPREGRTAFVLVALLAVLVAAAFHLDAARRVERPFLADSIEYEMMAREYVVDEAFPLKPVRAGFFSVLLAAPLYAQHVLDPDAPLETDASLWVLRAFTLLGIAGTFALGKRLAGRWAGLAAAFFVAILPEHTYWSVDTLTDVPAAACGVWALVFFLRERMVLTGIALGAAVALRYQSLIPLAAFLVVPVVQRRWRGLGWLLVGLVPPLLLLGWLDWNYWGRPFHTLLIFVPRQLTTFVPVEWVQAIFPVEAVQSMRSAPVNPDLERIAAKGRAWYLAQAPGVFTWWLLAGLVALPRLFVTARGRGVGVTLWVLGVTALVLSMQRYKELRYLVAIAPLVAALGGAGWVTLLGRRQGAREDPGLRLPAVVLLAALGALGARTCWELQARKPYRPFGASLEAYRTIPETAKPVSIAMVQPWILSVDLPVLASAAWHSYAADVFLLDLVRLHEYFELDDATRTGMRGTDTMEAVDYFLVNEARTITDPPSYGWLNERTVFDGYFFEAGENKRAVIRLRRSEDPAREAPFWILDDPAVERAGALARFAHPDDPTVVLELCGVEVRPVDPAERVVRLDSLWRLPADGRDALRADLQLAELPDAIPLAADRCELVPEASEAPEVHAERSGRALRLRRYLRLPRPVEGPLAVEVRTGARSSELGLRLLASDRGEDDPTLARVEVELGPRVPWPAPLDRVVPGEDEPDG